MGKCVKKTNLFIYLFNFLLMQCPTHFECDAGN